MKALTDSIQIGQLKLKNRLIRSATYEYFGASEEAAITDSLYAVYDALAKGGVSTIITGQISVDPDSTLRPDMPKAWDAAFVPAFRKACDIAHAQQCNVVVQLNHVGCKARSTAGDQPPLTASQLEDIPSRAMTAEDIQKLPGLFAKAAVHCKEAGADGVQIHAAHGYLLSQFLSPWFNRRTDAWGGPIENRSRVVLDVYDAIRAAVGPDYPIWIKINCTDLVPESITADECLWVLQALEKRGLDAAEISGGIYLSADSNAARPIRKQEDEGSYANQALAFAEALNIPVISVGGYKTPAMMEQWLNRGKVEALGICRALIADPDIAGRWLGGDRATSRCISCNKCYGPTEHFGCMVFK